MSTIVNIDALMAADRKRHAAHVETVDEVGAARARVEAEPLPRWQAAVTSWEQKVAAGRANVADAEAAFDDASRAVAKGEDGADTRQNKAHTALVKARGELEKASRALDYARSEFEESRHAAEVVSRDDYRLESVKRLREHQAAARAAAAKLEAAIATMGEADGELREALGGVAAEWATARGEILTEAASIYNPAYALKVLYATALPALWAVGEYDFFRGQQAADRNAPTATEWYTCPNFSTAFDKYISEDK